METGIHGPTITSFAIEVLKGFFGCGGLLLVNGDALSIVSLFLFSLVEVMVGEVGPLIVIIVLLVTKLRFFYTS